MEEIKSYGLDLEKEKADQKPEDWVFGVGARLTGIAEGVVLITYLPAGEVQRTDKGDMMDCATRAPHNIIETKINYWIKSGQISPGNLKWLKGNGYLNDKGTIEISDAFTAIKSKTTQSGNSLIAPIESLRKNGFVPKKLMPLEKWMTWEDYHSPTRITPQIIVLGKESVKRFPINYERVYESDFKNVRDYDMIDVAGYAWPSPINGIYPNPGSRTFNHAFCDICKTEQYTIFDNYIDPVDKDFIKRLASDYNLLDYGYRIIINENTDIPNASVKKNMYKLLRSYFDKEEVYAFNEQMNVKRHITNKSTLKEGARGFDQYWVWDETTPIMVATQTEFDGAMEMAEILLLTKDSEISTGTKFNFFRWLFGWLKRNN